MTHLNRYQPTILLLGVFCILAFLALLLFISPPIVHAASTWIVNNSGDGTATAANCNVGKPNTCRLRDAIAKVVLARFVLRNRKNRSE